MRVTETGPLVLALLALALAAGCLGGGEDTGQADTEPAEANETGVLEAPEWTLGDHWTWQSDQVGEVTYAVTGESGSDWIVDTTNEDVAFFDARFDVSTLGEVRKADLAGSQGNDRVKFFEWPLEENDTWTTTWDGVEREITVDRIKDDTAHLTARQNDRVAVEYTYDAEARSFGELVFLDENGTETFGMRLNSYGADFQDTAVRWQLEEGVNEQGTFGAQPASFGFGFEVPENATDIWLDLGIECPSGAYEFGFNREDGTNSYGDADSCPANVNQTGPVVEEPGPGTYQGGFTASSPDGQGSYSIQLLVRTLQQIAVGEG